VSRVTTRLPTEHLEIGIATPDGPCPSHVFRPAGAGPWPAVLVFMDGVGIRPAMLAVGARLASYGYLALLPDLFHRSGPYAPMNPHTVFSEPAQRAVLFEKFFARATPVAVMADTAAFLAHLAARPDVRPGPVGATGYCMGGALALRAAAAYPDRIAAVAAFHPGRLATDAPDSPHLVAPQLRARVYVAAAMEDSSFPEDMKARFEAALTAAGVDHTFETYPALHGWVLEDTPAYDAPAAERHWLALTALLAATVPAG